MAETFENINKENRKIATRIEEIHRSRYCVSMEKMRATTSLLKSMENNKKRISDCKQKSIEN